jgi:hypothetical protein
MAMMAITTSSSIKVKPEGENLPLLPLALRKNQAFRPKRPGLD